MKFYGTSRGIENGKFEVAAICMEFGASVISNVIFSLQLKKHVFLVKTVPLDSMELLTPSKLIICYTDFHGIPWNLSFPNFHDQIH